MALEYLLFPVTQPVLLAQAPYWRGFLLRSQQHVSGAFYSIFSNVFGSKFSILLVLLYLISSLFAIATIAAGIGQYISASGFIDSRFILPIEVIIIMVFCIINVRGVYLSGMLENGLTILKVVPLGHFFAPFYTRQQFFSCFCFLYRWVSKCIGHCLLALYRF